jgi:hypothetical protein
MKKLIFYFELIELIGLEVNRNNEISFGNSWQTENPSQKYHYKKLF